MKNTALYTSSVIFLLIGCTQLARFYLGISILIGKDHYLPVEASLYIGAIALAFALWMLIAALVKHRAP